MGCKGTRLQEDLTTTVDFVDTKGRVFTINEEEEAEEMETEITPKNIIAEDLEEIVKKEHKPHVRTMSAISRSELIKRSNQKSTVCTPEVPEKVTRHKRVRSESNMVIKRNHTSSASVSFAGIEENRLKDIIAGAPMLTSVVSETSVHSSFSSAKDIEKLETSSEELLASGEEDSEGVSPKTKRDSIVLGSQLDQFKEQKACRSTRESKPLLETMWSSTLDEEVVKPSTENASAPALSPNHEPPEVGPPIVTVTLESTQEEPEPNDIIIKNIQEDSSEETVTKKQEVELREEEKMRYMSLTKSMQLLAVGSHNLSEGEIVETSFSTSSERRNQAVTKVDLRVALNSQSRVRSNASNYLQIRSTPEFEDSRYSLETSMSSSVEINVRQSATAQHMK